MKTVTMDFETYQSERRQEYGKGFRSAVHAFQKIIREVKKGEMSEAHCLLCETLEDLGMTIEEFRAFEVGLGIEKSLSPLVPVTAGPPKFLDEALNSGDGTYKP